MGQLLSQPCEIGKHFHPYRCEHVPKEKFIELFARYPKLSHFVFWTVHVNWLKETRPWNKKRDHDASRKKWWGHPLVKKLEQIFQRELNYEKSTFSTQHIYHRGGSIYRTHFGYEWENDWRNNRMNFYHNGQLIESIQTR